MRNPKRIEGVLKVLGKVWKENPDLRLMQLLGNLWDYNYDPYYLPDEKLVQMLSSVYETKEVEDGEEKK